MKTIKTALAIPLMAVVVVLWLINLVTGTWADMVSSAIDSLLD